MYCLRPFGLVLVITALSAVNSMPSETTTSRSVQAQGKEKSIQESNKVMELNPMSDMVMDTRTPPRIKIHPKKKDKIEASPIENSHAGVAIPVDEDSVELEETTKKLTFYKHEKPTTNSGLSTWILLSGQTASTTPKKPIVKPNLEENKNMTIVVTDSPNKVIKPIFKKRVTTTRKPTTMAKISTSSQSTKTSSSTSSTSSTTTKNPPETTKFTKIKASVLTNAVNKKVQSTTASVLPKKETPASTTLKPTTMRIKSTTVKNKLQVTQNSTLENAVDSNMLPLEAKDGELDLSTNSTESNKKNKKPVTKRKKNKNRRRRPSTDKIDSSNSTKIDKVKRKEKPITTQFYNYLSREVMPTVGVGLVGLMVTAGLASYFLYPFGAARRSYDIDRRDKEGSYYYSDAYSGGIAEEEAIGKVIAGMPSNSLYTNTYKSPSSRNAYPNTRYRRIETRQHAQMQPNYQPQHNPTHNSGIIAEAKPTEQNYKEDSYRPNYQTEAYQPISYNKNVVEQNKDNAYALGEQKFVVGNVPKQIIEEITPAAVPEHGPRSLKIRRKRSTKINYKENEVDHYNELGSSFENHETTTNEILITNPTVKDLDTTTDNILNINGTLVESNSTTTTTQKTSVTTSEPDKFVSFVHLLKDILHMKINIGLQLIQNASQAVSRYASRVQSRINEHYRNYTLHHHH